MVTKSITLHWAKATLIFGGERPFYVQITHVNQSSLSRIVDFATSINVPFGPLMLVAYKIPHPVSRRS